MEKLYALIRPGFIEEMEYSKEEGFTPVTAAGQWTEDRFGGSYCINSSAILTRLIQETGRFALHNASDLFIAWQSVLDFLKERPARQERTDFVFGIYEGGVYGAYDTANIPAYSYFFRAIYVLRIIKDSGHAAMELQKAALVRR